MVLRTGALHRPRNLRESPVGRCSDTNGTSCSLSAVRRQLGEGTYRPSGDKSGERGGDGCDGGGNGAMRRRDATATATAAMATGAMAATAATATTAARCDGDSDGGDGNGGDSNGGDGNGGDSNGGCDGDGCGGDGDGDGDDGATMARRRRWRDGDDGATMARRRRWRDDGATATMARQRWRWRRSRPAPYKPRKESSRHRNAVGLRGHGSARRSVISARTGQGQAKRGRYARHVQATLGRIS
jgi:hypothetical protein